MGTDERIRDMHILLVDDSTYNLALFETMLMDDGYTRISTALNATSAYDLLARHDDIALVVLDIIMPDIDGLEACRYIKSQAPLQDIPILIATAKTDLETLQSAFDLGASDYVRKPLVNSIELLARVRNLLNTQLELQLRRQGEEQLRKLNQELEERVQAEVEKNRQKDQVMLHQARLAEMGEMIGYIAHQWRQPLNVVGLLCQEHYDHYCNGELSRDIMESGTTKILDQLEFMSQTIDDFRDFFRPDKSKSRFSIRHAIETTLSLVGAAMEKTISGCRYSATPPPRWKAIQKSTPRCSSISSTMPAMPSLTTGSPTHGFTSASTLTMAKRSCPSTTMAAAFRTRSSKRCTTPISPPSRKGMAPALASTCPR